jgi:hypothetical protein
MPTSGHASSRLLRCFWFGRNSLCPGIVPLVRAAWCTGRTAQKCLGDGIVVGGGRGYRVHDFFPLLLFNSTGCMLSGHFARHGKRIGLEAC